MKKTYVNKKYGFFTLLEVVIAIAILALGLVGTMALIGNSKKRVDRSFDRWETQHFLSQAAEYYLLTGSTSDIPDNIFYSSDYSADMEICSCEKLPADALGRIGSWRLSQYKVSLKDKTGKTLSELKIDKIIQESDLPEYEIEKIN